jgi:phosphohistidine phosphatase
MTFAGRPLTSSAMKTLYLLRHAKSSWGEPNLRDFDRPLNARGREAASRVGSFVGQQKIRPDLLLVSPAERARQTAVLVVASAGLPSGLLLYDERIYEADASRLLAVISSVRGAARAVMLVGHNPGLEQLLLLLGGEARHMPTAALACVTLDVGEWDEVRAGVGRLGWFVRPKELGG